MTEITWAPKDKKKGLAIAIILVIAFFAFSIFAYEEMGSFYFRSGFFYILAGIALVIGKLGFTQQGLGARAEGLVRVWDFFGLRYRDVTPWELIVEIRCDSDIQYPEKAQLTIYLRDSTLSFFRDQSTGLVRQAIRDLKPFYDAEKREKELNRSPSAAEWMEGRMAVYSALPWSKRRKYIIVGSLLSFYVVALFASGLFFLNWMLAVFLIPIPLFLAWMGIRWFYFAFTRKPMGQIHWNQNEVVFEGRLLGLPFRERFHRADMVTVEIIKVSSRDWPYVMLRVWQESGHCDLMPGIHEDELERIFKQMKLITKRRAPEASPNVS